MDGWLRPDLLEAISNAAVCTLIGCKDFCPAQTTGDICRLLLQLVYWFLVFKFWGDHWKNHLFLWLGINGCCIRWIKSDESWPCSLYPIYKENEVLVRTMHLDSGEKLTTGGSNMWISFSLLIIHLLATWLHLWSNEKWWSTFLVEVFICWWSFSPANAMIIRFSWTTFIDSKQIPLISVNHEDSHD